MRGSTLTCSLALLVAIGLAGVPAAFADVFNMPDNQKSVLFVPVGDTGNSADANGLGQVNYNYQMGMYDVTVAQYTQFLNAVAKTDPYGLWNSSMGQPFSVPSYTWGQIDRSGTSGNYIYAIRSGHDNMPVNLISWGSAVRFANWLSNSQPTTGVEDANTTERGSYTLDGAITDSALNNVDRNANATFILPSRNEWYKAAYYKGGGLNAGYWDYPTCSDTQPSNAMVADGLNNANFYNGTYTDPVNYLTDVGYFHLSASAYGAFDMGGLMWQWSEYRRNSTTRGVQGGSFYPFGGGSGGPLMLASNQTSYWYNDSSYDGSSGFRIAAVPEPAALTMLAVGSVGLLVRKKSGRRNGS